MSEPVLDVDAAPGEARAVALVLHGGRATGTGPVRTRHLAVVRMRPFATALRRAGATSGLAVARLRYAARGWNGATASPVRDVRWALDGLASRFPDLPVAVIGHSMGGRAAVYAADHENVRVVVGLAPWIEPSDPADRLAGRSVLIAHGNRDRVTSARASAAFAREAAAAGADVSYVTVRGERHAMVRRARVWHELTTGYVIAALCGRAPAQTVRGPAANLVEQALAGAGTLVV